jgi:hypothetical protein
MIRVDSAVLHTGSFNLLMRFRELRGLDYSVLVKPSCQAFPRQLDFGAADHAGLFELLDTAIQSNSREIGEQASNLSSTCQHNLVPLRCFVIDSPDQISLDTTRKAAFFPFSRSSRSHPLKAAERRRRLIWSYLIDWGLSIFFGWALVLLRS